jgi:hypothetical protein
MTGNLQIHVNPEPAEFVASRAVEMAYAMLGPGYSVDVVKVEEPAADAIVAAVTGRDVASPLRVTVAYRPTVT